MTDEEKLKIIIEAQNKAQKAFDEVNAQLKKTEGQGQEFNSKMESVGATMSSFGSKMSLWVTLPLSLLGKKMFSSAASFEQLQIAMETMLGSADKAKVLLEDLDKLAVKTPFQISEVQQAARQMLAYGIEAEKVVDTTRMLGDVSAGLGTHTFPQLTLAYGQIKAKGKLMGQELLQLTNAGFNLAEAMGVSRAELMEMMETGDGVTFEQVEQAFIGATSEGGRFHNMMANQSQTTSGKISNLKDEFERLSRDMGSNLLPAAESVVGGLKTVVAWFGRLSSGQQKAVVYLGMFLAAIGPVAKGLGLMITGLKSTYEAGKTVVTTTKDITKWTLKHGKSIGSNLKFQAQYRAMLLKENALKAAAKTKTIALTVAEKARTAATKIGTAVQAAFNAVMAMNPIALVVIAIVALIAILVVLYKKNKTVRDFINKSWKVISETFMSVFNTIKDIVMGVFNWIKSNWQLVLAIILGPLALIIVGFVKYKDQIMTVFNAIWNVVKVVWNGIVTVIKWAWENVIKPIWDLLVAYITNILIPYWKLVWNAIQTVWNAIVGVIRWAWDNVIKPIWDLIYAYITNVLIPVWSKIWEAVQAAWNFMKPIFEAIWAYITDTLVPIFQKIWDKVKEVFTNVWSKISDVKDKIVAGFNVVKDAIKTVVDKFGEIKDKISSAFSGVKHAISKPFEDAFNAIRGAWNNTLGGKGFSIPDFPGVPGAGKSFKFPKLYKGVRDFGGGLATVGDIRGRGGEIVHMPAGSDVYTNAESKRILRAIADGTFTPNANGGGVANTFTGNIYLMNAEAVKEFFKQLEREGELSSMGVAV